MTTILVTGALGFIGSHLVREFTDHGARVVGTRLGGESVPALLEPLLGDKLVIETADIASPHVMIDLCRRHHVDSLVHLAGPPIGVLPAYEEYRINLNGLVNVLEAAKGVSARRVSIASSIAVYFGMAGPLREDLPATLQPGHTIEAFKKAEELLGNYLAAQGGVDFVAMRLASIYGPLYRTRRHWPAQLVHAGVSGSSAPLPLPGVPPFFRDDHATDLCYVADAVRGIRLVHDSDRLKHKAYNIGGGQHVTYGRFAEAARALFPQLEVRMQDGSGPLNWPDSTLDLTRAAKDAGYAPRHSIEDAMRAYADWLRAGNPF